MLPSTRHHVTYAPASFDIVSSDGLGKDAFTIKYIITKCCPVPSLSCDLSMHLQSLKLLRQRFMRRSIYKKIQYLTFDI